MSFSIQNELNAHTVGSGPRQNGIPVEDLVAHVANLYRGQVFKRETEREYFPLSSVVPLRLRVNTDQNPFGVHEIFERCANGRVPLLIEGQPGCGKSTILLQLAALWQKIQFSGEPITEGEGRLCAGFNRYRLVVSIPLNELGGADPIHWEDYLFERLPFDDPKDFRKVLKQLLKKEEILFLVDDYSGAAGTLDFRATGIQDVLRTQHWVMTSRPGSYRGEGSPGFTKFTLMALSQDGVQVYIRSYFSKPEEAESMTQFISQFPDLEEITSVPFLLEILCFNWRENQARVFANATTSSLLQFLVLNILQKYLEKRVGKKYCYFTSLEELLADQEVRSFLGGVELEFGGNPNLLNAYRLALENIS